MKVSTKVSTDYNNNRPYTTRNNIYTIYVDSNKRNYYLSLTELQLKLARYLNLNSNLSHPRTN